MQGHTSQMCTIVAYTSNLDSGLYELGQRMDQLVAGQLTGGWADLSPASLAVVLLAGLLTSVSPCTLSVLPLTIGYIGGYAEAYEQKQQEQQEQQQHGGSSSSSSSSGSSNASSSSSQSSVQRSSMAADAPAQQTAQQGSSGRPRTSSQLPSQALCFSLGLASSLAGLGAASSTLGRAYGQIGSGLPTAVALVAILMGLNLLQVVQLQLPSVDVDVRAARLPPPLTAYLAGATFALAASPCSTPVLASLLAYASTSSNPAAGGVLLLVYSCGYVAPLLVAASATGAAKQAVLDMRTASAWVTPTSGVLLVAGGTYALLTRLLPAV
ncbi:cytochrome C biogenesis protein transmembrane region-domain-containing protein [Scenedesmus sp. NREL 46B-D3]|nr:cytochrome C biogenesis protein transmembrane region-domain-containing protein [Scenedesmus sp. NREL 46B-D3]